jgi:hypothetical protein
MGQIGAHQLPLPIAYNNNGVWVLVFSKRLDKYMLEKIAKTC